MDLITKEVNRLYRQLYGKMVASLVSFFRLLHIQLAEDVVQDTFETALQNWSKNGLPKDATAWLFKVCKNKTLNLLKQKRTQNYTDTDQLPEANTYQLDQAFLHSEIRDNRLRLLFAASHPDFSRKSSVILILKTLMGFKVPEIAKGLGMQEEAVKKSLTRTKKQIKTAQLPLKVPFIFQSQTRLHTVHEVLYLVFNEGYSASSGDHIIKKELCLEAIRLLKAILDEQKIHTSETQALLALMLFNSARFDSRINEEGIPIALEQQNRTLWDDVLIGQGIVLFNSIRKHPDWSAYHYEAAIASLHCTARHFKKTPWTAISGLYTKLAEIQPSSIILLNGYIAQFYATTTAPENAFAKSELQDKQWQIVQVIEALPGLSKNHLYWATLGKFYGELGDYTQGINHYLDAISYTKVAAERTFLKRQITVLQSKEQASLPG